MDPVVAYRKEGMDMYAAMIDDIRYETVRMVFLARPVSETLVPRGGQNHRRLARRANSSRRRASPSANRRRWAETTPALRQRQKYKNAADRMNRRHR